MRLESQGFVDKKRGRTLLGRSRAYIRVNGRDYSPHRRGFNVVLVNRRTGKKTVDFEVSFSFFFAYVPADVSGFLLLTLGIWMSSDVLSPVTLLSKYSSELHAVNY